MLSAVAVHGSKRNFWTNKIRRDKSRRMRLKLEAHHREETLHREAGESDSAPCEEPTMGQGATRACIGGGLQVFVQTTGASSPFAVEVASTCTLRDLVENVRSHAFIPPSRMDEEVTVAVAGSTFEGSMLGTLLADAGVSSEGVVEINSRKKSDIELLFAIFDNPLVNEEVLGFRSHEQFRNTLPDVDPCDLQEQHRALQQHLSGLKDNGRSIEWNDQQRVVILYSGDWDPSLNSDIHWDVLAQLTELTEFTSISYRIARGGTVPFDKLPRNLKRLALPFTQLMGVKNIQQCPIHLCQVDLGGRSIRNLDADILAPAQQLPSALLDGHRGEGEWELGNKDFHF